MPTAIQFKSTKKLGPISVGHRQWRDDGHCQLIHGYGRYVEFTFAATKLDHRQWVMDFGGLKKVKQFLEDSWDHRLLVASDDPAMDDIMNLHHKGIVSVNVMDVDQGHGPGIEGSCKYIHDNINPMIEQMTDGRVWVERVQIWEHERNTAIYNYTPTDSEI